MNDLNLVVAWAWVVLGVLSGLALGLGFQRDDWLGGYGGWRRRLYRLGHISLFGMALINLMFYLTAREVGGVDQDWAVAGLGFVVGAVGMPICCLLAAHWKGARILFSIPVLGLLMGAVLTLWEVFKS